MNNSWYSSLLAAINWIWLVVTLLVFLLLIKLGAWQSERAIEKEQRLARIEQLLGNEAQDLSVLLNQFEHSAAMLNDMPVQLVGHFDPEIIFLLDNQPNQGQLGYRVYQVFTHAEQSLLVNLGWVKGSKNRGVLPDVNAISGTMTLTGNIRFIDVGVMLAEQHFNEATHTWPLRIQQVEIDKISRLINKQLLPFAVFLDKKETVGYQKNWQPVVMPPEKHWGYAFQWFSLAFAWLCLMVWATVKSYKNKYNKA